jgi:hypothetical protein
VSRDLTKISGFVGKAKAEHIKFVQSSETTAAYTNSVVNEIAGHNFLEVRADDIFSHFDSHENSGSPPTLGISGAHEPPPATSLA